MARTSPIQESFVYGEISGRVRGRVSSDAYLQGLGFDLNWTPLPQGPVRTRNGLRMEGTAGQDNGSSTPGANIRIFTFQRGVDKDVLVEMGTQNIILRDATSGGGGDIIEEESSDNLVVDPTYSEQTTHWSVVIADNPPGSSPGFLTTPSLNLGDLTGDFTNLFPNPNWGNGKVTSISETRLAGTPNVPFFHTYAIRQQIFVIPDTDTNLHTIKFDYFSSVWQTGSLENDIFVRLKVGSTAGGSDLLLIDEAITVDGQSGNIDGSFTPIGLDSFYIELSGWQDPVSLVGTSNLGNPTNIEFFPVDIRTSLPTAGGTFGANVQFPATYRADQRPNIQFVMDPGEQEMWFTHPEVETQRLKFDGVTWTFDALTSIPGYKDPPNSPWGGIVWPKCCTIHDGRLWLGNAKNRQGTIWGSRIGEYVDLDSTDGLVEHDDPVTFPLSTAGAIQWLASKAKLIVGTDIKEIIGVSAGELITPEDFGFPVQTEWGSVDIQPAKIGKELIFIPTGKNRLRSFQDEGLRSLTWDGQEISLLNQELFSSKIIEIHYADDPDYQILAILGNGTIAAGTYLPGDPGVMGWYRISTPQGKIKRATLFNTSEGTIAWFVVEIGTLFEYFSLSFANLYSFALDGYLTDTISTVTGKLPAGATAFMPLYLDSTDISFVVEIPPVEDGGRISYAQHPSKKYEDRVDDWIFEDWARGKKVHYGTSYAAILRTLPTEGTSRMGTSQTSKRMHHKIFMRLNDSAMPEVNGRLPHDRSIDTPMDQAEPFRTGDIDITNRGWGNGVNTIIQPRPFITELVAVFSKTSTEEV